MPNMPDDPKRELIAKAAALASSRRGGGGPPKEDTEQFLRQYYRHVALDDLADRGDVDVYGAAVSQYRLAQERPQGTAMVRVFTPTVDEHGWSAEGHTVVEVVTDDMSFLVDSVTMELYDRGHSAHLVIHPQLLVRRDITGRLAEVIDDEGFAVDQDPDVTRESWMHVEIDREADPAEVAELEVALRKVLQDVREAVEDWERMRMQALDVVADLDQAPPQSLPQFEIEEAKELLRWLVRRPLHVPGVPRVPVGERRRRRRPAGGTRHRLRHPARRPGHVSVVRLAATPGA